MNKIIRNSTTSFLEKIKCDKWAGKRENENVFLRLKALKVFCVMIKDNLFERHISHKTISTKPLNILNIKLNLLEMQRELDENRIILREYNISLSELEKSSRSK